MKLYNPAVAGAVAAVMTVNSNKGIDSEVLDLLVLLLCFMSVLSVLSVLFLIVQMVRGK